MNIQNKIVLIVVVSIVIAAIPASLLVYQYSKSKILSNERTEIVRITNEKAIEIAEYFHKSIRKLTGVSRSLVDKLEQPVMTDEITSFYDVMQKSEDGVWRNDEAKYNGHYEAGIFLPPNLNQSDRQKIDHIRIKTVFDYVGAASTDQLENIWYLSPDRSEVIFDTSFPRFVYDQHADNDYTNTPWVNLTRPKNNPNKEVVFTPPLFDPVTSSWLVSSIIPLYINNQWIGTLGEDMHLTSMLGSLFSDKDHFDGIQVFLLDANDNYVLAGDRQTQLEASPELLNVVLDKQSEFQRVLKSDLLPEAQILSKNLQFEGVDYVVVGMTIEPINWRYFEFIPIAEVLKPAHQLFSGLIVITIFASLFSGLLISAAANKIIVDRIRSLAFSLKSYDSNSGMHLDHGIVGNDEISSAANEFDVMVSRLNQNLALIHQSKNDLHESEQRWHYALEGSGDGVWDWNIASGDVLYSARLISMLGYHSKSELPTSFFKLLERHVHKDEEMGVIAQLNQYLVGNKSKFVAECRFKTLSGNWIWLSLRGTIVKETDDYRPLRMIGTFSDITAYKDIEIVLRQSGEQLRQLLESSPIAVRIVSAEDSSVLFVNKSYTDMLNIDEAEVQYLDPAKYYINKDEFLSVEQELLKGNNVINKLMHLRTEKNKTRWVLASYLTIRYENHEARLAWFSDITQRLDSEKSLRLHASVFDNTLEGIMITDANNHVVSVNSAFTTITGYLEQDVLGQNPSSLSASRENKQFYKQIWQEVNNEGHWKGEAWSSKKNGKPYLQKLTITTVNDESGKLVYYVGIFSDITELKQAENQLQQMAHYDQLTSLPNRVLLADRLSRSLAQAKRTSNLLVVCFLDLDGFKGVNDEYGHDVGDDLLVTVANRLTTELRDSDTVARIGGDEFVILLGDIEDKQHITPTLDRINHVIAESIIIDELKFDITASIGVTIYPLDDSDSDTLLRHADLAMYEAKQSGRNRFHIFDTELDQQAHAHHKQLQEVSDALENGEFELHYQPKVNLKTNMMVGAEALIRWRHPEKGIIPPFDFLPLVENTDIIVQIGDWVINQALAQMNMWQLQGKIIPISVNVAARQIQNTRFIEKLGDNLALYPELSHKLLQLEILETSALETVQTAQIIAKTRKSLGVSFALDDFGTGYSSLAYLKQLPATTLKIDRTFVRDMLSDKEDQAIVEGIVNLAKVFGQEVIAEGVETQEHGEKLLSLGCHIVQGYGIAKPMSADRVLPWVKNYEKVKV
jgi:diguanylate cyclase (GGDEF)-like protein/PAS domain S-box-containing protein